MHALLPCPSIAAVPLSHLVLAPCCVCWSQLLELLTTFVDKPQFRAQVQAALKEMMYVSTAYLQMTQVSRRECVSE